MIQYHTGFKRTNAYTLKNKNIVYYYIEMTVQIKPLLGYVNPINDENNTLSLLIKSNCQLQEHLSNSICKTLSALKCIMKKYDSKYSLHFYHKIKILCNNKKDPEYYTTKKYEMHAKTLEIELSNSIKEISRKDFGKLLSHFINITISLNDEPLVLNTKEFTNLNWLIRNRLAKINNKEPQFFDNEETNEVGKIEKNREESLFIDDNEVGKIEKNREKSLFIDDNEVGKIEKNREESLFIDDDDNGHFKKTRKVSSFIDNAYYDPFEKSIHKAKEIALHLKRDMMKTNKNFISILGFYYNYLIS